MCTFTVNYIDDQGNPVSRFIKAWHAAAAERTTFHLFGGTFHTALENYA